MPTLIDLSKKSFEELLTVADVFRDSIAREIASAMKAADADDRRRLRDIAGSLDEVSTVKLIALALYNDEAGGVTLDKMAWMLADIGPFHDIASAADLVAAFDDDVAALDRKLLH